MCSLNPAHLPAHLHVVSFIAILVFAQVLYPGNSLFYFFAFRFSQNFVSSTAISFTGTGLTCHLAHEEGLTPLKRISKMPLCCPSNLQHCVLSSSAGYGQLWFNCMAHSFPVTLICISTTQARECPDHSRPWVFQLCCCPVSVLLLVIHLVILPMHQASWCKDEDCTRYINITK